MPGCRTQNAVHSPAPGQVDFSWQHPLAPSAARPTSVCISSITQDTRRWLHSLSDQTSFQPSRITRIRAASCGLSARSQAVCWQRFRDVPIMIRSRETRPMAVYPPRFTNQAPALFFVRRTKPVGTGEIPRHRNVGSFGLYAGRSSGSDYKY